MSVPIAFSNKARRTGEQPISYLIAVAKANPGLISFAAGLVDPLTLPGVETAEIAQRLLGDEKRSRDVLQYGTTNGLAPLRAEVVKHLEKLDNLPAAAMNISADSVVLTTGSQQALYILADILIDPGDIVLVEAPSYFVYAGALQSFGARMIGVPMDRDGMVVEEIDRILNRLAEHGELARVKAVYCQSYFQNPTGLTLSLERRKRLVEIVRKHSSRQRIVIIEDAAYRELSFTDTGLPSIKSFDGDNSTVVSCYTFDKPYAAGLKAGYVVAPPELARALVDQKGNHDFGSSHLCQHIVYEALIGGVYAKHVAKLRESYKAKADVMLAALNEFLPIGFAGTRPGSIQWTIPGGGLYTWLSLPIGVDTSRVGKLFERSLAEGVLYVPGEYCFSDAEGTGVPQNHMRLCYATTPIEQIRPGVEKLARAIEALLAKEGSCLALTAK